MKSSNSKTIFTLNITNRTVFVVMLCLATLTSACALSALVLPQQLGMRLLVISPDKFGSLEFSYEACKTKVLGVCIGGREMRTEYYDLNDFEVRDKLIAADFVCHVRERP